MYRMTSVWHPYLIRMTYECHTYDIRMASVWHPYDIRMTDVWHSYMYVICVIFVCHTDVRQMSCRWCHTYVIRMLYRWCHTYVIRTSFRCHTDDVIRMSYGCYTYTMTYGCYTSDIWMSYAYIIVMSLFVIRWSMIATVKFSMKFSSWLLCFTRLRILNNMFKFAPLRSLKC